MAAPSVGPTQGSQTSPSNAPTPNCPAATLLAAGLLSGRVLSRLRPGALAGAERGKRWLGGLLVLLGVLVLSGADRQLEALAIGLLPDWATSI